MDKGIKIKNLPALDLKSNFPGLVTGRNDVRLNEPITGGIAAILGTTLFTFGSTMTGVTAAGAAYAIGGTAITIGNVLGAAALIGSAASMLSSMTQKNKMGTSSMRGGLLVNSRQSGSTVEIPYGTVKKGGVWAYWATTSTQSGDVFGTGWAAASPLWATGLNDILHIVIGWGEGECALVPDIEQPSFSTAKAKTGTPLDDWISGGTYSGGTYNKYVFKIDAIGATDTFKWSDDGGTTWEATGVAITGGWQTLNNGVKIKAGAVTGHRLNDSWEMYASATPLYIGERLSEYYFMANRTYVMHFFHAGTSTQTVDTDLQAYIPGYDNPHRFTCYSYVRMKYPFSSETQIFQTINDMMTKIKKVDIYDTRTSTSGYTNNAALIYRDFLTNERYARGLATARTVTTDFNTAASACDPDYVSNGGTVYACISDHTSVAGAGGNEPGVGATWETYWVVSGASGVAWADDTYYSMGFQFNGVISDRQEANETLKEIALNFNAFNFESEGKHRLKMYANDASAMTFADMADEISINPEDFAIEQPGIEESPNIVQCNFINPDKGWGRDNQQYPDTADPTSGLIPLDGNPRKLEIDLIGTTNPRQAKQIAKFQYNRLKYSKRYRAICHPKCFALEQGDMITATHEFPEWVAEKLRVDGPVIVQEGLVPLTLMQESATIYDLEVNMTEEASEIKINTQVISASLEAPVIASCFYTGTIAVLTIQDPGITELTYNVYIARSATPDSWTLAASVPNLVIPITLPDSIAPWFAKVNCNNTNGEYSDDSAAYEITSSGSYAVRVISEPHDTWTGSTGTFSSVGVLRLGYDDTDDGNMSASILFSKVSIPKGSTINSATLTVQAISESHVNVGDTVKTKVYGDVTVYSGAIPGVAPTDHATFDAKTLTTAFTVYDVVPATGWTGNVVIDVKTIVQEIVNNAGWLAELNMQFMWLDNGTTDVSEIRITEFKTGNELTAPLLTVTYTQPSSGIMNTDKIGIKIEPVYELDVKNGLIRSEFTDNTSFLINSKGWSNPLAIGGNLSDYDCKAANSIHIAQAEDQSGTAGGGYRDGWFIEHQDNDVVDYSAIGHKMSLGARIWIKGAVVADVRQAQYKDLTALHLRAEGKINWAVRNVTALLAECEQFGTANASNEVHAANPSTASAQAAAVIGLQCVVRGEIANCDGSHLVIGHKVDNLGHLGTAAIQINSFPSGGYDAAWKAGIDLTAGLFTGGAAIKMGKLDAQGSIIEYDSNDYSTYDRDGNVFSWVINNAAQLQVGLGYISIAGSTSGRITLQPHSAATGTVTQFLPDSGGHIARLEDTLDGFGLTTDLIIKNSLKINGSGSGQAILAVSAAAGTPTLYLPTTGGTLARKEDTLDAFAATSSAALYGKMSDKTGTGGLLVFATSPALTTPSLGAATATTINKVTITEPAVSATLTIATGKTFTCSNTLTLTATDGSTLAIGTGGTLGTGAYANISLYATLDSPTFTTHIVTPIVEFDSNDYITYNKASDYFSFVIGGAVKGYVDTTGFHNGSP